MVALILLGQACVNHDDHIECGFDDQVGTASQVDPRMLVNSSCLFEGLCADIAEDNLEQLLPTDGWVPDISSCAAAEDDELNVETKLDKKRKEKSEKKNQKKKNEEEAAKKQMKETAAKIEQKIEKIESDQTEIQVERRKVLNTAASGADAFLKKIVDKVIALISSPSKWSLADFRLAMDGLYTCTAMKYCPEDQDAIPSWAFMELCGQLGFEAIF